MFQFTRKPKHVGAVFLILKCFNNSTFLNVVCISWKIKCWILLMHGVAMMLLCSFSSLFNPLPLLFKALLHGQKDRVFFQQAFKFTYYARNRSPLQEKKIITIKLKKTE